MSFRVVSLARTATVLQSRCLCTRQVSVSVTDDRVQDLLGQLTGMTFDLVFSPRKEPLAVPHYKLMSLEQLKEVQQEAQQQAGQLLKMPPILPVRSPRGEVIERDGGLEGATEHTMVFTDTTQHKENKERRIVARERDGTLREATWEERDRMCQLFFPVLGRKMTLPDMLSPDLLPQVLGRESCSHLNILDCVGVQCEPDSEDYLRVHATVFDDIDRKRLYDVLRSTRYHGCMVWHLLSCGRINRLLAYMVRRERLSDAATLVELYLLCYPESQLAKEVKGVPPTDSGRLQGTELLKVYCQHYGLSDLEDKLTVSVHVPEPPPSIHWVEEGNEIWGPPAKIASCLNCWGERAAAISTSWTVCEPDPEDYLRVYCQHYGLSEVEDELLTVSIHVPEPPPSSMSQ